MEKRRLSSYLILLVLILVLAGVSPVGAAPQRQSGNLLQNPSFEQPFVNGTAEGWSTWALQTEKTSDDCLDGYHYSPKWNMETGGNFVSDGVTSQYIGNNWDTWAGGVYQTVNVTPGVTYRFSFVSKGRATSEASPAPSEFGINMNIRAGIDPDGSGQWNDGDIVWSAAGSPHDTWQTFSTEATATGDKLSVFTWANFGVPGSNQCRQFLDTWYDNAQLVSAGPPPANTAPPAPEATQLPVSSATQLPSPTAVNEPTAAPPPTESPEQQPQETAEPTAVSEIAQAPGGTICVNAFHDENANGVLDANEGYMAGVTMVVAGDSEVVGQAISDGSDTPTCFYPLQPGPYQVAQQIPGRLEMTTAGNALVAATDNHTVHIVFGSRLRQQDSAASESGGAEVPVEADDSESAIAENGPQDEGFSPIALSGLAVILIGVVLLGLLLFFLLRR